MMPTVCFGTGDNLEDWCGEFYPVDCDILDLVALYDVESREIKTFSLSWSSRYYIFGKRELDEEGEGEK